MLSEFVKAYRFKNCLTQKQLADYCNLSCPILIAIEQGKKVSSNSLKKLAEGTNRKYSFIVNLYQQEQLGK